MVSKTRPKQIPWWLPVAGVMLFTCLLYARTLTFDFTGYDDDVYVTDNPNIQRGVSSAMIGWAFTTGYASNWHPLTWLSHAMDWQLAGRNAWLHHATNMLLHALNSALLFVFLHRATKSTWRSLMVAALFAVHPLNVESVAWVAERKNVLSMCFGLLSFIAYVNYARTPSRGRYATTAVFLILGLMSKPMLVTWPFAMLLLDYWPLGRISTPIWPSAPFLRELRKFTIEKIPLFAIVIASSVTTYLIQAHGGATKSNDSIAMSYRVGNALVSYCNYVIMTIWPFGLTAFYPHPLNTLPIWKPALALAVLIVATVAVVAYGRKSRYLVAGWFFFLGTLVPVIGFVQVGSQAMSDRYAYVPLIGLFIIAVWGIPDLVRITPRTGAALGVATIALLSARTWDQLPHWRNGVTLWQHAVAVTRDNYIAHNNLGTQYLRAKQPDLALVEFKESLRIRPNHPGALVNIGSLLLDQAKPADAAKAFESALGVNPNHGAAHLNLALAYFQMHNVPKALEHANLAKKIMPYEPKVYNLLGILADARGDTQESVNNFQKALQLNPSYKNAQINLDRVLSRSGRPRGATGQ